MTGALLGGVAGGGLLCAIAYAPPLRRPTLEDRVAPYLRDGRSTSRLLTDPVTPHGPFAPLEALARPFLTDAAGRLDRILGGTAAVRRRLQRAGDSMTVEQFRLQQVLFAAAGGLFGAILLAARFLTGTGPSPLVGVALTVAGLAGGAVLRDSLLSQQVRKHEEDMLEEFPTVAELLALAVTAGEGPVGALERVVAVSGGALAKELSRALADARAGATLVQALEGIAERTTLSPILRFVDGMVVAIERGTPLSDVLRAQAVDAREARKRHLLESGGRKEIAMMLPVVFLVLPTTVVFALYPGVVGFSVVAH